jgi:hypothetical protein
MNSGKGLGVSVNPLHVFVSDKKEVIFACDNCMAYFMRFNRVYKTFLLLRLKVMAVAMLKF